MGIYSTMEIERDDAVAVLKAALDTGAVTDDELGDMLFALFGERKFHNFRVTCCPDGPYIYTPGALRVD